MCMKSMALPSQAYAVKLAPHLALFSVLKFTGHGLHRCRYSDALDAASDRQQPIPQPTPCQETRHARSLQHCHADCAGR